MEDTNKESTAAKEGHEKVRLEEMTINNAEKVLKDANANELADFFIMHVKVLNVDALRKQIPSLIAQIGNNGKAGIGVRLAALATALPINHKARAGRIARKYMRGNSIHPHWRAAGRISGSVLVGAGMSALDLVPGGLALVAVGAVTASVFEERFMGPYIAKEENDAGIRQLMMEACCIDDEGSLTSKLNALTNYTNSSDSAYTYCALNGDTVRPGAIAVPVTNGDMFCACLEAYVAPDAKVSFCGSRGPDKLEAERIYIDPLESTGIVTVTGTDW